MTICQILRAQQRSQDAVLPSWRSTRSYKQRIQIALLFLHVLRHRAFLRITTMTNLLAGAASDFSPLIFGDRWLDIYKTGGFPSRRVFLFPWPALHSHRRRFFQHLWHLLREVCQLHYYRSMLMVG
ncbi:hypothetical protein PsorP6_014552 [Peronosclerospora sorghi]|uniref:Uncharacterized protein n=1 Tax=Peronosclerospora sorghi TaxID=230839 RepID=A0ACC0VSF4_9STRA|nr:hypothetical protein PsorP6_014552 [Peronosclerospora sorghi]